MKTDPQFSITKDDNVTVDFYSELMNNYFPESSIKASNDIRSLMIAPERPIIFCLDKENRLQAILRAEGSAAGWLKLMLSESDVKSFEIEYNIEEDSFRIAKVENNKVWVSQEFPLSFTKFETLDKDITWQSLAAETATEQIDKVSLGAEQVLYATSEAGKDAIYYVANLDDMQPKHYTFPEHAKNVIHFELGNFLFTSGVFFLYSIGNEKSLLYQSFPDPTYNKVEQTRFECEESINCFALLEAKDGNDIVYAAGKKVHVFAMNDDGSDFNITTLPGTLEAITKIRAAYHDNERSVWTLDNTGLHYRTNRFFNQSSQKFEIGKWIQPILMVEGADQFSCLKGKGVSNQLFSINTSHGSELTRLWQDSVSTLWNKHTVTVSEADSLKEVESYSAHIKFKTETATKTFAGQKVKISADTNIFAYINSKSYHIGPNHEVTFELGIVPEFTLICPVTDIAGANIYLKASFLTEDASINLANKVLERIQSKIQTGNDLKNAKKQNGESLVPKNVDSDTLDSAAKGIQEMLNVADNLESNQKSTVRTKSAPIAFSLNLQNGSLNPALKSTAGDFFIEAGITLGDFLNTTWQRVNKVGIINFIIETVEDGLNFIIEIGDQIFKWVVKTLREIGGFIQKIFDSIKVFFEDIFKFIAFLFDWNAILDTKNAFKDFTNNAIISLKNELGNIKNFIDKTLEAEIAKFSPELVNIPDDLSEINPEDSPKERDPDPRSNWLNSKKDSVSGGEQKSIQSKMPTEFSSVLEDFINNMKPILEELGQGFISQVELIADGFKKVISGEMVFVDFIKLLLNKLAGFALFLVKQIIDIMLTSLSSLLDVAQVALNKEWNIPLLSNIYKDITGEALTFLDAISLFVAIPTTILYKIGEGEAPFDSNKNKEDFIKSGLTTFQLNLS